MKHIYIGGTLVNLTAVRTFRRVFTPVAQQFDLCADSDRQFDGGEFSDSAISYAWDTLRNEYLWTVGQQFDLSAKYLGFCVDLVDNHEQDCFIQSIRDKPSPVTRRWAK